MTRGHSHRGKRDANEPDIRSALEAVGWSVDTAATLDLVAAGATMTGRRTALLEVKDGAKPRSAQALTGPERAFIERWRGEVYIVRSVDDALAVVSGKGAEFERLRAEVREIQERRQA